MSTKGSAFAMLLKRFVLKTVFPTSPGGESNSLYIKL